MTKQLFFYQELGDLTKNPTPGITAGPIEEDLFHWQGKDISSDNILLNY